VPSGLLEQGGRPGLRRPRHAHGRHDRSPINGQGIAGVAPRATLVALKAGTAEGYFFTDSVVNSLIYAGDLRLDAVNMSFFADPWLFNCRSNADQRAIIQAISRATSYAQQHGVVLVAAAGNDGINMSHPTADEITRTTRRAPGHPERETTARPPTEMPGVVVVSATGAQNRLVVRTRQRRRPHRAVRATRRRATRNRGRVLARTRRPPPTSLSRRRSAGSFRIRSTVRTTRG
jgi:hypothetical protein